MICQTLWFCTHGYRRRRFDDEHADHRNQSYMLLSYFLFFSSLVTLMHTELWLRYPTVIKPHFSNSTSFVGEHATQYSHYINFLFPHFHLGTIKAINCDQGSISRIFQSTFRGYRPLEGRKHVLGFVVVQEEVLQQKLPHGMFRST